MGDRGRIALAFLIIIGILFIWTMMNRPAEQPAAPEPVVEDKVVEPVTTKEEDMTVPAEQDTIVFDRENIRIVLSSFGASVRSFYLKDYDIESVIFKDLF